MMRRDSQRRLLASACSIVAAIAFLALDLSVGCGSQCEEADARPLDFVCDSPPNFIGELHFDSAPAFDTFLRQQCLYISGRDEQIDAIMASVDFSTEAVFVAVGPAEIEDNRCLRSRELEAVETCTDGVRVYFEDDIIQLDGIDCATGRWTVAFVMDKAALLESLDTASGQGAGE